MEHGLEIRYVSVPSNPVLLFCRFAPGHSGPPRASFHQQAGFAVYPNRNAPCQRLFLNPVISKGPLAYLLTLMCRGGETPPSLSMA